MIEESGRVAEQGGYTKQSAKGYHAFRLRKPRSPSRPFAANRLAKAETLRQLSSVREATLLGQPPRLIYKYI